MRKETRLGICLSILAFALWTQSIFAGEGTPPVAGALPEESTHTATTNTPLIVPEIIPALLPSEIVPEIPLNFKETEAVSLSEDWKEKYTPPTMGRNGQVIYHFGESIASVVTAPGNVTDIELEAGELITENGIFVGDSVNWEVSPLAQKKGTEIVSHIIVKPFLAHLETTMTVLTDRRTYYFYLHSTLKRFMTSIAFSYPKVLKSDFVAYQNQIERFRLAATKASEFSIPSASGTGIEKVSSETLDFKFELSGDTPAWTPVRVYSSAGKTYIQMPRRMRHTEAPVFLALGDGGNRKLVNYRVQGDTYVIDSLFSAGVLFAGIGGKQSMVRIDYVGDE